jgi:hypothetical protein
LRRRVHGDITRVARGRTSTPGERAQRIGKLRAGALVTAAAELVDVGPFPGLLLEHGGVTHHVAWVRPETVAGAETAVRIRPMGAPPSGDSDIVVVNPPTLVRDPSGDIEVAGRMYREDPLAALAEVLTRNLGGQS